MTSQAPSLPTEMYREIVLQVAEVTDLYALTQANAMLADIASPIYARRMGIPIDSDHHLFCLEGDAILALPVWRRSSAFAGWNSKKQLKCVLNDKDYKMAGKQIRALITFLSTPSIAKPPFYSIYIQRAVFLPAIDLLRLLQHIDRFGIRIADISAPSLDHAPTPSLRTHAPPSKPSIVLNNLDELRLDIRHLKSSNWAYVLGSLEPAKLATMYLRGHMTIHRLTGFLSRSKEIAEIDYDLPLLEPRTGFQHASRRLVRLPALTDLRGPPRYVSGILKSLLPTRHPITLHLSADLHCT